MSTKRDIPHVLFQGTPLKPQRLSGDFLVDEYSANTKIP